MTIVRGVTQPGDLCLYVPYDPAPASANRTRGRHWGVRQAETDRAHLAAAWAWCEAGQPAINEPVTVDLVVFRERRMDDDNLLSGLKSVRDYLFHRITPDDSAKWLVYGTVRQVTGTRWAGGRAWTVFVVKRRSE